MAATPKQARALRRVGSSFRFEGLVRDLVTDSDVRVRFTLTPERRLVRFRGPPADTSQPAFPIRPTFYYAWYPEAWSRGAVAP